MENKINIAELLRDCPKGIELDCVMCNNPIELEGVVGDDAGYPIKAVGKDGFHHVFTSYGASYNHDDAKCVIFPKGKTTWEGFVPPCKFKEGDIVYIKTKDYYHNEFIIIFKEIKNDHIHKHACFAYQVLYTTPIAVCHLVDIEEIRFVTEEEKAELFKAIKENGYKWNEETKTLEKLITPKFKVGDRIIKKNDVYAPILIARVDKGFYYFNTESYVGILPISDQDSYELVPNKFDISTLKPFESRVLVRDGDNGTWHPSFWGYYEKCSCLSYDTVRGFYNQCIPYEGNEHLLGTKGDCEEYFKTWEE